MSGEFWIVSSDHSKRNLIEDISAREPKFYVKIEDKKITRTALQRSYQWGWVYDQIVKSLDAAGIVIPLEDGAEHPYTADILHEIFKTKLLPPSNVIKAKNGKELIIPGSTANMPKKAFSEFIDSVKNFVYQVWGIQVPEPTRGKWFDYYKELGL